MPPATGPHVDATLVLDTILTEVMRLFWRLLGFLRPYRRGVIASFLLAAAAIGGTIAIPYLTGRAIDQIRGHHRHTLTILALAIGGAALLRLGLTVSRRLVAGRVS